MVHTDTLSLRPPVYSSVIVRNTQLLGVKEASGRNKYDTEPARAWPGKPWDAEKVRRRLLQILVDGALLEICRVANINSSGPASRLPTHLLSGHGRCALPTA
jgi:hypothetical protein